MMTELLSKKKCIPCGKVLELTRFYKRTNGKSQDACKLCWKLRGHKWSVKNKDRVNELTRAWAKANPDKRKRIANTSQTSLRLRDRLLVLNHYAGNPPRCVCCNEANVLFLTIDHIRNDGYSHRKITGAGSGLIRWIIKNNYPDAFQIMCFNCNCGRARTIDKTCPHGLK